MSSAPWLSSSVPWHRNESELALLLPSAGGRRGGRPVAIDAEKLTAVVAALDGGATRAAACRTFGIKRSTLIDSLEIALFRAQAAL
jgi:hypothetical protein